ncbi:MAG: radical SAM protein [bacterium]|nr:radical SAM protein [bacterium]
MSYPLNICSACLRDQFDNVRAQVEHVHCKIRAEFGLPEYAPKQPDGIRCGICVHECRMGIGMRSYCGLRLNCENQLSGVSATQANVSWYFDRLPTNCVADWVCPGGTGCGYPDYAYVNGAEYGYKNLAVFYHACTFDCLFCQNWHYREQTFNQNYVTAEQLADVVDGRTACICYFGGDPTAQLPHAILVARLAQHKKRNRILRICWETNGSMNPELLGEMLELSLESGGCIKFDLKAWTESVHIGLCGTSNKRTLSNFALAAERVPERPIPPLVIASTLLIPGYVEIDEVSKLAQFIARLNPDIPYSLLAFHPEFYMTDLPPTSKKLAEDCKQAALHAGVNRVNIGNIHLLTG